MFFREKNLFKKIKSEFKILIPELVDIEFLIPINKIASLYLQDRERTMD